MHTTPLKDDRANYSDDSDLMVTISISEVKYSIAEEVDCIHAERTPAENQIQI